MTRSCVQLPSGGFMCGQFTKADVEALEDPNEQLQLDDDALRPALDRVQQLHRPPP